MSETDTASFYTAERETLVKRLHRIEGQVRGIERMLRGDRYCIDVLTQVSAVNAALEALAIKLLDGHVDHCVALVLESGDPDVARDLGRELRDAVHRFARTR